MNASTPITKIPVTNFRTIPFFNKLLLPIALIKASALVGMHKKVIKKVSATSYKERKSGAAFGDYKATIQDIYACVYTKSGTNLLLQALVQLAWKSKVDFEHIHDLVAWPDIPTNNIRSLRDKTIADACPIQKKFIKTALIAEVVPYHPHATYFTILRDPKEVFVSGYHFIPRTLGIEKSIDIEDWLDLFLSDNFLMGCWAEHTASYWNIRNKPNVHLFYFSEILSDTNLFIDRLATVLNIELNEAEKAKILHKCSFEFMKKNDAQFAPPKFPLVGQPPAMLRSGKTGNSKEMLSPDMAARIDAYFIKKLKDLDSDFPYKERFCT